MTRQYIPVEEAFKEWRKDPEYVAALASALIKAGGDAHLRTGGHCHGHDAGICRPAGKRPGFTLHPYAGTVCQSHAHPPVYQLRAG